ncbi:MAG: response regulator [Rhodomicrobium sp.]
MPRILIVDDEPLISMLLEDWLNELGHEVVGPANNVASALALIESGGPNAAILDVTLGSETGYPVAERLAERNIPFVFATGHAEGSLLPPHAGAPVLTKPFDFAAVRAAIAGMVEKAPG